MNQQANAWWRGATIYQIYPRSFYDANNDGVGDLPGITEKLDYVASLGVDGIWISPFFTSPMDDFGYDVADYRGVDPIFGTIEDFKTLVDRAHELGLKVVIDQVYSHTSDQHEWFQQSRQDNHNDKADWYVWADAKPDGMPPTNWQSPFGGSSWKWDNKRKQYYLHNFLPSQPDLNLHNPDVQQALLEVARFWLELGVDGFRLDAINYGMHDLQFRDNPPATRTDDANWRPYIMQEHRFNVSQPGMVTFLEQIRTVLDEFGATFSVAEVGGADPVPVMHQYTEGQSRLHTAYSFEFLCLPEPTIPAIQGSLANWPDRENEGWPAWAFSNHDAPRVVSRWENGVSDHQRSRLYNTLLLSLRGNVFVYQGEELGLQQADVPFEALQDPEAIAHWPDTMGRDGARTPMPWQAKAKQCGFSQADKTWLPIDPRHPALSVDQQKDPQSNLNYFRRLLKLRQQTPALRQGSLQMVDGGDGLLAFIRQHGEKAYLCAFNLTAQGINWQGQQFGALELCICSSPDGAELATTDQIPAYCGAIFKISEPC